MTGAGGRWKDLAGKLASFVPVTRIGSGELAEVDRMQELGTTVVLPVHINRDDSGREICRIAVILDPEGNSIMLHQKAAWRD